MTRLPASAPGSSPAQAEAVEVIQLVVNYKQAYNKRDAAEVSLRSNEGITGRQFAEVMHAQVVAEDALVALSMDSLLRLLGQQPAAGPAPAEADVSQNSGKTNMTPERVASANMTAAEALEKAALWDGLLGAARLRALGWAGDIDNEADPVTHFGMEFWTRYPGHDFTTPNARARQLLTAFARAALAAAGVGS